MNLYVEYVPNIPNRPHFYLMMADNSLKECIFWGFVWYSDTW